MHHCLNGWFNTQSPIIRRIDDSFRSATCRTVFSETLSRGCVGSVETKRLRLDFGTISFRSEPIRFAAASIALQNQPRLFAAEPRSETSFDLETTKRTVDVADGDTPPAAPSPSTHLFFSRFNRLRPAVRCHNGLFEIGAAFAMIGFPTQRGRVTNGCTRVGELCWFEVVGLSRRPGDPNRSVDAANALTFHGFEEN